MPQRSLDSTVSDELERILGEVRELRLQEYETSGARIVMAEVVPRTDALLGRAQSALAEVLDAFEAAPGEETKGSGPEGDFLAVVDTLMEQGGASHLADLAFIGRMELSARRQRLSRMSESTPAWGLLSCCHGALRRIKKAVTALRRALREHDGEIVDVGDEFVTEVTHALEIRHAYTVFRRSVDLHEEDPGPPHELLRRLRLAAIQMAVLVGRSAYENARIMDRMELRRLQGAILAWLRDRDRDPGEGRRLWQDLTAFAGLLEMVNRRGELIEHDLAVLFELREVLSGPDAAEPDRFSSIVRLVRSLEGRDDTLDNLVAELSPDKVETLRPVVCEIAQRLESETAHGIPKNVISDITDVIVAMHAGRETGPR